MPVRRCPCPSSVNEMISINLDAGLRPVSFYPADDEAPAAVLLGMGRRWTGGCDCDRGCDRGSPCRDPFGGQGHKVPVPCEVKCEASQAVILFFRRDACDATTVQYTLGTQLLLHQTGPELNRDDGVLSASFIFFF